MRICNSSLLVIAWVLFIAVNVQADSYALLKEQDRLDIMRRATAIVDATVVRVEPNRFFIDIHHQFKGDEPPEFVKGFRGNISVGSRKLFILYGENLEVRMTGPIRERADGQLEYLESHGSTGWALLSEFERRLPEVLDAAEKDPVRVLSMAAESKNMPAWSLATAHESLKHDAQFMRVALRMDGSMMQLAPPCFRRDRELVLETCFLDTRYAGHDMHPDLSSDREFLLANGFGLLYADNALRADREFVIRALRLRPEDINLASPELQQDQEILLVGGVPPSRRSIHLNDDVMRALIKRNPRFLEHASSTLKQDAELVYLALLVDPDLIRFADVKLQTDPVLLHQILPKFPYILGRLPESVRDDRNLILAAIGNSRSSVAAQLASARLKRDRELMLLAIEQSPHSLEWVHEDLRSDPTFAAEAVRRNLWAAIYLKPELRDHPLVLRWTDDKRFVIQQVLQEPHRLQGASQRLLDDPEVVMAMRHLFYASKRLCSDREFVKLMIDMNPDALHFASQELRSDRELVLKAARYCLNDAPLVNAGPDLQDDREVVMTSVRCYGGSIRAASKRLRSDPQVVIAAIEASPEIVLRVHQPSDGHMFMGGVQWHPDVRQAVDEAIRKLRGFPEL